MPHKQSLRRKENLRGLCPFFKEISSSLVIKKSEKRLQHQFWANLQKYLRDAFLSIQKHIHCSKEAFSLLHYKKQRVILQIDIERYGHLDRLQRISQNFRMIFNKSLLGFTSFNGKHCFRAVQFRLNSTNVNSRDDQSLHTFNYYQTLLPSIVKVSIIF